MSNFPFILLGSRGSSCR